METITKLPVMINKVTKDFTGGISEVNNLISMLDKQFEDKYSSFGGSGGFLGPQISGVQKNGSVYMQTFKNGCIVRTNNGLFEIHGAIYQKWTQMGGVGFGLPITNETPCPDQQGRYNHFMDGKAIYWHPSTGAFAIYGAIYELWSSLGWENSSLGYPTTDETPAPDTIGRQNNFQRGIIYWSPVTGAFVLQNDEKWNWNISFSDSTPLGGNATLALNSNGDIYFSGHLHDSGFPSYDFAIVSVLMTKQGMGYTSSYKGHTGGTLSSDSRDNDWNITVNNPSIKDNWPQITQGTCYFKITSQDTISPAIQELVTQALEDLAKQGIELGVKALVSLIVS